MPEFILRLEKEQISPVLAQLAETAFPAAISVGLAPFDPSGLTMQEWEQLREKTAACSVRLYADLSSLMLEDQLADLKTVLAGVANADGIYYGDEAVLSLLSSAFHPDLIYDPVTLACSSADVLAYRSLGADYVSLAHELSLAEILSLAAKTDHLEVLIHGYFPILTSGRRLVSNYGQAIGKDFADGLYSIQEASRTETMPLVQSAGRTIVYSEAPLQSMNQIGDLVAAGIGRLRIDGRFLSSQHVLSALSAYSAVLESGIVSRLSGSDRWYHQSSVKTKEETL